MAKEHSFFLHCDACHHEVDFEGDLTAKYIGYPCPECGESMLTERDYKVGRRIQWVLKVLDFFRLVKPYKRGDEIPEGYKTVRFHTHNGRTTVEEMPDA